MRTTAAIAATTLVAGAASANLINSTFDTDLEGWTAINDVTPSHVATGGNPDGFMRFDDHASGPLFFASAPASELGNFSAANGETLSFDAIVLFGSGSRLDTFGEMIISGPGGSAQIDIGDVPASNNVWTNYSTPMTAAAWGVSDAVWTAILSNVTELRFQMEAIQGDEATGLDNFIITPAPASLAMLLAGAPLLTRRRGQ